MSDIERYYEIVEALNEAGWCKVAAYIDGEYVKEKYDNLDSDGAPAVFISHSQIKNSYEISIVVPDIIEAKGKLERTTVIRLGRKPTNIRIKSSITGDSAVYLYDLDLEKGALDIHYVNGRSNG